jgi:hypothetical protein
MFLAHLAAFAATALALALPVQARPDPLNPRAEVPPPRTPAALRGYRPATTPEPGQWREANDNVARIGGWKTYLREAQQADAAPAAASAAPAASAPRPAGHHHGHR